MNDEYEYEYQDFLQYLDEQQSNKKPNFLLKRGLEKRKELYVE